MTRPKIKRFLTSVNASNCYLCWCPETREGAIIDPAEFTSEMRSFIEAEGINLKVIYLTHSHFDHNAAVGELMDEFDLPVAAAEEEYPNEAQVSDGETLLLGNLEIKVAALPGHTEDSIAFIAEGSAFVGDALFAAAVGGTADRRFFEQETTGVREKLFTLPPDTVLYPGHGPATTVALERTYNPFFF
jgi:hydroxyacylglutathione hydrolase